MDLECESCAHALDEAVPASSSLSHSHELALDLAVNRALKANEQLLLQDGVGGAREMSQARGSLPLMDSIGLHRRAPTPLGDAARPNRPERGIALSRLEASDDLADHYVSVS
jgi:hypothetical protein